MFINKTGSYHLDYGLNNQDYGLDLPGFKLVVDGCSEGKHSEVGAKLFCCNFSQNRNLNLGDIFKSKEDAEKIITNIFKNLINYFDYSCHFSILDDLFNWKYKASKIIKDYLCFTIAYIAETEETFELGYCGDGYVILETNEGNFNIVQLGNGGNYPKYFAYNYIPPEKLSHYKEGVKIDTRSFSKEYFKRCGVATDGFRFIFEQGFYSEFIDYLRNDRQEAIKRLINREARIFRDDITIAF